MAQPCSTSLPVAPIVSLFIAFFTFVLSLFIFIYPLHSIVTLGRLSQKETLKRTLLGPPCKGHVHLQNRKPSSSWMAECSYESLSLFVCDLKQTENFQWQLYLVVYKCVRCIITSVLYYSGYRRNFWLVMSYKGHFSKGKLNVLFCNYSKHIYSI